MVVRKYEYPGEALSRLLSTATAKRYGALLREVVDVTFLASIEREEGRRSPIRVVFHEDGAAGLARVEQALGPGQDYRAERAWSIFEFEQRDGATQLTPRNLSKAAPLALAPRSAVIVGLAEGKLQIEGVARRMSRTSFDRVTGENDVVLCVSPSPGSVVMFARQNPILWYEQGEQVDVSKRLWLRNLLDHGMVSDALRLLCGEPHGGAASSRRFAAFCDFLERLILNVGATAKGGLIGFLPVGAACQAKFPIKDRSQFALSDLLNEINRLGAIYVQRLDIDPLDNQTREGREFAGSELELANVALRELAESTAYLASIDNAVLFGEGHKLLGAGFHIETNAETLPITEVTDFNGTLGATFELKHFGSRHRAAATLANSSEGGVVFVISEDGPMRCMLKPVGGEVMVWNLLQPIELL